MALLIWIRLFIEYPEWFKFNISLIFIYVGLIIIFFSAFGIAVRKFNKRKIHNILTLVHVLVALSFLWYAAEKGGYNVFHNFKFVIGILLITQGLLECRRNILSS